MELKDFLEKVKRNEAKKLKLIQINIKDYGYLEFTRPSNKNIFAYYEALADTNIDLDIEKNETKKLKDTGLQELPKITKASSELIYNCSSFLKSKELRNMYPGIHNFDIPVEIFGWSEVIGIAAEIVEKFGGVEEAKKDLDIAEAEIKN